MNFNFKRDQFTFKTHSHGYKLYFMRRCVCDITSKGGGGEGFYKIAVIRTIDDILDGNIRPGIEREIRKILIEKKIIPKEE